MNQNNTKKVHLTPAKAFIMCTQTGFYYGRIDIYKQKDSIFYSI